MSGFNFSDVGQKFAKGFGTAKQFTSEKLGLTEELTALPEEFKSLEVRTDKLKSAFESLVRALKHHIIPSYDTKPVDVMLGAVDKLKSISKDNRQEKTEVTRTTPSHQVAEIANENATSLGVETPIGKSLKTLADSYHNIGEVRLKTDEQINQGCLQPLLVILDSSIKQANHLRKAVHRNRLELDSKKAALKNARPEKTDAIQYEISVAEDVLKSSIAEATVHMKALVESSEPLKILCELVNAQLEYFKRGYEILSQLAPELDGIHVAQEHGI